MGGAFRRPVSGDSAFWRSRSVAVVLLVGGLFAGDPYFVSIDYDDIIASINMRGIFRLVLTTQAVRNGAGHASESQVGRVDKQPVLLNLPGFGAESFHRSASDRDAL